MNFSLNDKMITDHDNKIVWTFGYLKEEKNLSNLISFLCEENDILITKDSFFKSRDYIINNHPEFFL